MIIENIDEEPEEIRAAWNQFCKITNEKITSESRIAKMKSLDNPFAMKSVALWYADSEYYTEEKIDKNYLKWILKTRTWIEKRYQIEEIDSELCKKLLAWSYEAEGLIYSENLDDESRKKAIRCLETARKLNDTEKKINGEFEIEYADNSVLMRLKQTERAMSYMNILRYTSFLRDLTGATLVEIKEKAEKKAEELIEDEWCKLHETSKKQIVTALYTLKVMEEANGENDFDYSAIVSLLSRALEYEVKIRFYKNYLEYLKEEFQINDYVESNNLTKSGEYKSRKLIVDVYEDEEGDAVITGYHEYDGIGEKQFTLGSINYPIGFSYKSNISSIDSTFLDYCKNDLWEKESTEEDIIKWITSICRSVLELSETRNHASHGGYNLCKNEAVQALDDIILIGKILVNLLKPCKGVHS